MCSHLSPRPAACRSPFVTGLHTDRHTDAAWVSWPPRTGFLLRRVPSQRVPRSVRDLSGSTGPGPSPAPAPASTKPCHPRSGGHEVAHAVQLTGHGPCRGHRRQCLWGRVPSCLHRAVPAEGREAGAQGHPPPSPRNRSHRTCWLCPSSLCHLHRQPPPTSAPAAWDCGDRPASSSCCTRGTWSPGARPGDAPRRSAPPPQV